MAGKIDLIGQRFSRWLVIAEAPKQGKFNHAWWLCRCDCGTERAVCASNLKPGTSKSCGCLWDERVKIPYSEKKDKMYSRYGITLGVYHDMLTNQSSGCAVCGYQPSLTERRLSVDHDHQTGVVRGLLCHHCNMALGHARDKVDRLLGLVNYLSRGYDHVSEVDAEYW